MTSTRPFRAGVRLAICVLAASTAVLPARAAQEPALVQFDVAVVDAQGQPVRGLTPADFEIQVDGRPATVAGAAAVDLPPSPAPSAPPTRALAHSPAWTRTVPPDVVRNDAVVDRFIAIVIDDAAPPPGGSGPAWVVSSGLEIARGIVNRLGPDDRAAVFFAFAGRQQAFTADRAKLLEAIEGFKLTATNQVCGASAADGCAIAALQRAADTLPPPRPSKTTIAFITGALGVPARLPAADAPAEDPAQHLFRTLDAANAAVYTFGPPAAVAGSFAAATGGRAIVDTIPVPAQVDALLADTVSFYRFAVQAAGAPARYSALSVRVNRPGAVVRARSGYYAPGGTSPAVAATPIEQAIVAGAPVTGIPLGVTVAAFGTPGRREAVVSIAVNLTSRPEAGARGWQADVAATSFDRQWRPQSSHRQTIEVTARPDGGPQSVDVVSALELLPGRYELRIGAASGARTGSVFVDLDVPEFLTAPLSASGLVVSTVPKPYAPLTLLAETLPVVPATRRIFARGESVEAFVRFYQGNRARLRNMTVSLTVSNDAGEGIIQGDETILPSQFVESTRATDWRFLLPVDRLAPGEYLLTVEGSIDDERVTRQVRFTVAQPQ
jgi:VWFA-related protein